MTFHILLLFYFHSSLISRESVAQNEDITISVKRNEKLFALKTIPGECFGEVSYPRVV